MNESVNSSENESLQKIQYQIKRESKLLKFNDINEVEEETTYLIRFDKKKLKENKRYVLETPLTYFRIPEGVIQKYQEYQKVKQYAKFYKESKKYLDEYKELTEKIKQYDDVYKQYKEDLKQGKYIELENLKAKIKGIEKEPGFQKFIQNLDYLEIKDLNTLLIETKSEILFEKIIWCYIFEEIFNSISSILKDIQEFVKKEVKNENRETKINKINIPKLANKEIEKISIREFIEESGNFEKIMNYPYSKRKDLIHHNLSHWSLIQFYLILAPILILLFLLLFTFLTFEQIIFSLIIIIILMLCSLLIFELVLHFKKAKYLLMKRGKLKDKFDEKTQHFLIKNYDKENLKIKLLLDSFSDILFRKIY